MIEDRENAWDWLARAMTWCVARSLQKQTSQETT
jgi:hypothetical protein